MIALLCSLGCPLLLDPREGAVSRDYSPDVRERWEDLPIPPLNEVFHLVLFFWIFEQLED